MSLKRGDFALVYFPHSDLRTVKLRPVLVVQAEQLNTGLPQVVVAMVSSNLARAGHPSRVTVLLKDPLAFHTGLKSDSVIMTDNLGDDRTATCQMAHRADAANGTCRSGTAQYTGIVSRPPFRKVLSSPWLFP
jgi:mRNA-degrading endonuclease toxin of MazEF toxin-antitoxin module